MTDGYCIMWQMMGNRWQMIKAMLVWREMPRFHYVAKVPRLLVIRRRRPKILLKLKRNLGCYLLLKHPSLWWWCRQFGRRRPSCPYHLPFRWRSLWVLIRGPASTCERTCTRRRPIRIRGNNRNLVVVSRGPNWFRESTSIIPTCPFTCWVGSFPLGASTTII